MMDLLGLEGENPATMGQIEMHHPMKAEKRQSIQRNDMGDIEPLLVSILVNGKLVYRAPSIEEMRKTRQRDEERLDPAIRRLIDPDAYSVYLSKKLWELRRRLTYSA